MTPEYELAVKVGKAVDLLDVSLQSSHVELHVPRHVAVEALPWNTDLAHRTGYSFDESNSILTVVVQLRVEAKRSQTHESEGETESVKEENIATVEVGLELLYSVGEMEPDLDLEEAFPAFAAVNGMYNAWPYFREFVQAMVARMGLPPHLIPTYRVQRTQSDEVE